MRKHFLCLSALFFVAQFAWAITLKPVTAPANIPAYYSGADGKSGKALYDALNTITNKGFSSLSYDAAIDAYQYSDVYPTDKNHPDYVEGKGGQLWDMYGACSFVLGNECGNYGGECDCYNREHSIPKSWWGGNKNNMYSDIFHLVPTDGYVNNRRSAYAFGVVTGKPKYEYNGCKLGSPASVSTDKATLLGTTATCGSSPVFEPNEEYKGDFARGYLGMIAKYSNSSYSITSGDGDEIFEAFQSTTHFGLTQYGMVLLMKWHREDPVSRKEIDRNNGIQKTQGNRNPFIDYPYLAEYIWGEHAGEKVDMSQLMPSTDPDFIPGVSDGFRNVTTPYIISPKGAVDMGATNTTTPATQDVTVKGANLENGSLTLAITNDTKGYFSLATYTITKTQAEAGYVVTVTYSPTTEGNHTATLTINGCGISNYTISLSGSCTALHTIVWRDDQNTQMTAAATGAVPSLPANTPADCSEYRVFMGWTAAEYVDENQQPADLFTTPTKTVSGPVTYYAVYADKEVEGDGGGSAVTTTLVMEDLAKTSGTMGQFTIATTQNSGQNAPAYNANGKDLRIYAKGSITIGSPDEMNSIVFGLSVQGLKRLAPITATTGSIATQAKGDTLVTWTGAAKEVTFTVGEKANYGTEDSKAGQLCIAKIQITAGTAGTGSTTYSNYAIQCEKEYDPTDIEQVGVDTKARKVLIGGQIYIIRDNQLFNVQGQRLQ